MKIIFFGLGSIGKRHAELIKANFNHELYAFRSDKDSPQNDLGIKEIYNIKELKNIRPDIAFITNPTSEHIRYAIYCAGQGIDLFIEKPLSNNTKDIKKLEKIAKQNKVRIYVAYCLRFHPVIQWIKEYLKNKEPLHLSIYASSYLPQWRKETDHLKSYSAKKDMGGGAILDLSHEIDYVYYLLGEIKEIKSNSKKISDVTIDSEDFADILIRTDNDVFCNIHLNFFSRLNRRNIIIDFIDETIICDIIKNDITIKKEEKDRIIHLKNDKDSMYLSQLNYFFDNMNNDKIMNNLEESMKVFENIMRIKKVSEK